MMTDGGASDLSEAEAALASEERLTVWVERFRVYRQPPDRNAILRWLARFSREHLDIAHRILDSVIILSELQIHEGYKASLDALAGWSRSGAERAGRWYFVGAGSAGESGPAMLRMFREANGLTSEKWDTFFKTPRELPGLNLSALDHVIFVDDFAGSGKQIVGYWPIMQELVASEAKCYLFLTAVTRRAEGEIQSKTELDLRASLVLEDHDNLFDPACNHFTDEELGAIEAYGEIAWAAWPRGYENCGLTLVLSHKTPNNTIPILHSNKDRWVGLFPRNLIAA